MSRFQIDGTPRSCRGSKRLPTAPTAHTADAIGGFVGGGGGGTSGGATLADLYDPLTMPADLARAHAELDRAVDRCYRAQPFPDERRRFEYLFALYEQLIAPLTAQKRPKRKSRKQADESDDDAADAE